MRKILRILLLLIILFIFTGICLVLAFYSFNRPPENGIQDRVLFTVEKGESLSRTAERLERENIIRKALLLRIVTMVKGTEQSIKSGNYEIAPHNTTLQIHDVLVQGRQVLRKITIPEGWTIRKIAAALEQHKIVAAEEFIEACASPALLEKHRIPGQTAEGYLFPDTYHFPENFAAEKVIEHMINTMFQTINEIEPEYEKLTRQMIYQKIIIASIVEREYRVEDEAPLIASVFYNRLHAGMGLESCATVEYIITEIEDKPHPTFLTYEDLDIESPYNTYLYAGLPPGPICNPGKTALDAAFHPAETDFWYFLLKEKESGRHYFSKDLQEHIKARRLYLKNENS